MRITATFEGVTGAPKAILYGFSPSYSYENGVRGASDGTKYHIICFGNDFERVSVKVPGMVSPPITKEELKARNAAGDFVYCSFEDFSAKTYEVTDDDGNKTSGVTAKAKKLVILNPASGAAKS